MSTVFIRECQKRRSQKDWHFCQITLLIEDPGYAMVVDLFENKVSQGYSWVDGLCMLWCYCNLQRSIVERIIC